MPDPSLLTPLAQQFVSDIPLFLQDQPDIVAVLYAQAKEHERLTSRIDGLVSEFLPTQATSAGLPLLEAIVNVTINPVGASDADRRTLLSAYFGALRSTPEGSDWVAAINGIVGPGWSYREHNPDNPNAAPPAYTILVSLPFPPDSDFYARTKSLIRQVTPAHLDLIVTSAAGFALDRGRLDDDTLA